MIRSSIGFNLIQARNKVYKFTIYCVIIMRYIERKFMFIALRSEMVNIPIFQCSVQNLAIIDSLKSWMNYTIKAHRITRTFSSWDCWENLYLELWR